MVDRARHPRRSWTSKARRGFRRAGTRSLGLPPLRWLAPGVYRAIAERVTRELMRVPGVRAVLLNGSLNQGTLVPGASDIDLMVTADLPTLDDELVFRRRLSDVLVRVHRTTTLVAHLDYAEHRDLPWLWSLGPTWLRAPVRPWTVLAGETPMAPPGPAPVDPWEVIVGVYPLWSVLLRQLFAAPGRVQQPRHAKNCRRSLDLALALEGGEPGEPLVTKLERARAQAEPGTALRRLCADPHHTVTRQDSHLLFDVAAAVMELVNAGAARLAPLFAHPWPHVDVGHGDVAPPPAGAQSIQRAVDAGVLMGACLAPAMPGAGHPTLVLTGAEGLAAEALLLRCLGVIARVPSFAALGGNGDLAVLPLTPAMLRAAALVNRAPLLAASLVHGSDWTCGEAATPGAPRPLLLRRMTEMALVELLYRPRGRALRAGRPLADREAKFQFEVERVFPAYGALWRGVMPSAGGAPLRLDERECLRRYRERCERVRAELVAPAPVSG